MKIKLNSGILLIILALVAWFLVLRPQIKNFSDLSFQAKVRSVEVDSYNARLQQIGTIKNNQQAFQDLLKSLYLALPKTSQIPEVLVMVESLGTNSGIVFNSANVGSPNSGLVPITLTFSGKSADVSRFLDALRTNVRTVTVKNQTITADATGNLAVTMQLGMVYQGDVNGQ